MASVPDFYDEERVGTLFYPDLPSIASAAEEAGLQPAGEDVEKVQLLLVDMQIDFCHPEGALYVPGAEDDIRRICEFIFRHAAQITDIICTLDSHLPFQIFHPSWWIDDQGRHPEPLTIIENEDVRAGKWQPAVMPDHSVDYVRQLEKLARKKLTIWPYHVLIGSIGNAMDPMIWSAVMWHALARKTQPAWISKGRVPHSEHYSAVQPEIEIPDHPQGQKHKGLLSTVQQTDALFVAGEAQSHCVLETLEDLVSEFRDQPDVIRKIYVLIDCMSPVVHPEVDFGAIAERRFAEFADLGVNFVSTLDELGLLTAKAHRASGTDGSHVGVLGLQRMAEWETLQLDGSQDNVTEGTIGS